MGRSPRTARIRSPSRLPPGSSPGGLALASLCAPHRAVATTIERIHRVKISRIAFISAIGAVAALSLAGCAVEGATPDSSASTPARPRPRAEQPGRLRLLAQQVAIQSWTKLFTSANPDAQVQYGPQGSGAGRRAFQQGGISSPAPTRRSRPRRDQRGGYPRAPRLEIVEIPATSPIAIVFTLKGVDSLNLDPKTCIAGIAFRHHHQKWNDPAIVATSLTQKLPDGDLAVHRSDEVGTANFTDYLAQTAPDVWTAGSVDTW